MPPPLGSPGPQPSARSYGPLVKAIRMLCIDLLSGKLRMPKGRMSA